MIRPHAADSASSSVPGMSGMMASLTTASKRSGAARNTWSAQVVPDATHRLVTQARQDLFGKIARGFPRRPRSESSRSFPRRRGRRRRPLRRLAGRQRQENARTACRYRGGCPTSSARPRGPVNDASARAIARVRCPRPSAVVAEEWVEDPLYLGARQVPTPVSMTSTRA